MNFSLMFYEPRPAAVRESGSASSSWKHAFSQECDEGKHGSQSDILERDATDDEGCDPFSMPLQSDRHKPTTEINQRIEQTGAEKRPHQWFDAPTCESHDCSYGEHRINEHCVTALRESLTGASETADFYPVVHDLLLPNVLMNRAQRRFGKVVSLLATVCLHRLVQPIRRAHSIGQPQLIARTVPVGGSKKRILSRTRANGMALYFEGKGCSSPEWKSGRLPCSAFLRVGALQSPRIPSKLRRRREKLLHHLWPRRLSGLCLQIFAAVSYLFLLQRRLPC